MRKRSSGLEANGVEHEDEPQPQPQPQQPSSSALVELHKENENGEQTLVPSIPIPNLDDGFYEIETIRRKRLRKGQLQYLIKWRGWPETANTWEPIENLQLVPDLIDAFEESLKSGKHRKRKRTSTSTSTNHVLQLKNCLQRSTTSYSLRHFSQPQPTDYDPKLSELKAPTNTDNLAIHFQQPNAHVQVAEPIQRGSKRRKSASVKRFKTDTRAVQPPSMGNNTPVNISDAKIASNIVKIIKPIGYSASLSDNIQDVLVTFMAMRSDGTEVMVDNRYLKAYNPLLLINFYELHLRYSPTS